MSKDKSYKGVIFDLDQTLANTEDYTLSSEGDTDCKKYAEWQLYSFLKPYLKVIDWRAFQSIYAQAKEEVKSQLEGTAASHNRYLYIQRSLELTGLNFSPQLVLDATNVYWNYIINKMRLFPEVEKTLKTIKESHLTTAVLSDLTADIQIKKLSKLGIDRYIDLLVTSEEARADKPDLKPFLLVLRKMNCSPKEALMVGNNPKTDITGATRAGMNSLLYDYYNKYPDFKGEKTRKFSDVIKHLGIGASRYSSKSLLIFDLVGTLTTESHLVRDTLRKVLQKKKIRYNYSVAKKAYEALKVSEISDDEFWGKIGVPHDIQLDTEIVLINAIKLRSDVTSILSSLHQKHKTALLSNIPSRWGNLITQKFNLYKYFDTLVFSGDHKTKKPDPKLYRFVLSQFPEINPSNVFIIDNELGDLKAAKNYLMKTIWLRIESPDEYFVPDSIIGSLSDLKKTFLSQST